MKKIKLIYLLFIITILLNFKLSVAQTFAPKDFYLVDSLVLEELTVYELNVIDSCLNIYHGAKYDTAKIAAIDGILGNMMHEDWAKYVYLQYGIIENALANRNSKVVKLSLMESKAIALNNIGYIYKFHGNIILAMEYYLRSLEIDKEMGNSYGVASTLSNIGSIYYNQGDISLALEYNNKSLALREEIGDSWGISISLNNIGYIYDEQGNDKKAIEYYQRSLNIEEELDDYEGIAVSLNNIGAIYNDSGDYGKALDYYQRSIEINVIIGNNDGIAGNLNNIGNIYQGQGDTVSALKNFQEALKIYEKIDNKDGISNSSYRIGLVMLNNGKVDKAKTYAEHSMMLAQGLGFPVNIRDAAGLLSNIYEEEKKGLQALEMHKLYIIMRDSIVNEEVRKEFVRQEVKYEFEKAELIRKQKEQEEHRVLAEQKSRRHNLQYSGISIALFILFGFLYFAGKFTLPHWAVQLSLFLPFLLLFEFLLIFIGPFVDMFTGGEPAYNLLVNASIAALISPMHSFFEALFKRRLLRPINSM